MRLTLRTLLAYLDDVLPPEEAEKMRHRIEESEFASTLVQRIQHAVKRSRLGAPKVDARGLGFDPNSVAEYLDSVLASDRVTDFERVCLESDVHLAEVAACHQILCKVLTEPAEISEELRSRIHKLPTQQPPASRAASVEAAATEALSEASASAVVAPAVSMPPAATAADISNGQAGVERAKPEIPDYLRPDPTPSRWPLVGVLGFMAVAALVLLVMSPLGLNLFPTNTSPDIAGQPLPAIPVNPQPADEVTDDTPPVPSTDDASPDTVNERPLVEEKGNNSKLDVIDKNGEAPLPNAVTQGPPRPDNIAPPEAEMKGKPDVVSTEPPATPAPEKTPETPAPELVKPTPTIAVSEAGKFISDESVLVRFNAAANDWDRVPQRALINGGEQFVSLPVYRPQMIFAGLQVTMVGEGKVVVNRGRDVPNLLEIEFGKFLLASAGMPSTAVDLNLHGIKGRITLDSVDAEVALEVLNFLPPGDDPALGTARPVVVLYGVHGAVQWEALQEAPVNIELNRVYVQVAGDHPFSRGPVKLPAWIDPRNTPTLDREAAKLTEQLLATDRPIVLALEELAQHRRIDVRAQVARSLAFLERYDLIATHCDSEEYRGYWGTEIESLRTQVARGGETALELQRQLMKKRGEKDGETLYRLLWGFSEEQLLAGDSERRVKWLEDPHTDIRLLAWDNLKRITGTSFSYNPAFTPEKNRSALVRWSKALKDREIAYATRPTPVPEFQIVKEGEEKK